MYAQKTIPMWMHTHKFGFPWWGRFPPLLGQDGRYTQGKQQIWKGALSFPTLSPLGIDIPPEIYGGYRSDPCRFNTEESHP